MPPPGSPSVADDRCEQVVFLCLSRWKLGHMLDAVASALGDTLTPVAQLKMRHFCVLFAKRRPLRTAPHSLGLRLSPLRRRPPREGSHHERSGRAPTPSRAHVRLQGQTHCYGRLGTARAYIARSRDVAAALHFTVDELKGSSLGYAQACSCTQVRLIGD